MSIPKITLEIATGDTPGLRKTFQTRTIKLGKLSSSHFFVADPNASRMQALIEVEDDGTVQIIDLSSLHGTYVNGNEVKKGPLADGDIITIGATRIHVTIEAPPSATATPPATDEDITEDTLDRPAATAAERIEGLLEKSRATTAQREATRKERLAKKAACDADRTLAVALLYEAVHRAEAFAHEVVLTERMLTKLKAMAEAGQDVAESIAMLEARKEIAEEALPALLDIRAHRKRLLELTTLASELDEPSTEELWTTGAAGALMVSPYLLQWRAVVAEAAEAAEAAAVDPGSDPIPAGPTP